MCSYSGNKEEIKEKGFQISEICIGIEQERYKFVGDRHPLRLVWSVIIIWGPRGATSELGFINSARMTLGVTRNTFPWYGMEGLTVKLLQKYYSCRISSPRLFFFLADVYFEKKWNRG